MMKLTKTQLKSIVESTVKRHLSEQQSEQQIRGNKNSRRFWQETKNFKKALSDFQNAAIDYIADHIELYREEGEEFSMSDVYEMVLDLLEEQGIVASDIPNNITTEIFYQVNRGK